MKNKQFTITTLLSFFCLLTSSIANAEGYEPNYGNDRAQIIDLQNRYVLAMDFQDADAYGAVFAEDAILDWAGGIIETRAAIQKFMSDGIYNPSKDSLGEEWPAASRHFITNQVIKVDGNKASAVTYWLQANNNADRGVMTWSLYGHYEDELEKINGEWLFTKRAIYNEGIQSRHRAGTGNPSPWER